MFGHPALRSAAAAKADLLSARIGRQHERNKTNEEGSGKFYDH